MTTTLEPQLLIRLHRILQQKSDLESRIRKCPVRATLARKAANDIETGLADLREKLKATRISADQKQLQLTEREGRIEDYKIKRNTCESNREYQLLSDQIAADQQANSILADETLELLERLDSISSEIARTETELKRVQAESLDVEQAVHEELAKLGADLDLVRQEFSESIAELPADVRTAFGRLVESVGEDALACVEDSSCGHCNTTQTTQVLSDLMMKQAVFCKSCGSLMYLPQNAAV